LSCAFVITGKSSTHSHTHEQNEQNVHNVQNVQNVPNVQYVTRVQYVPQNVPHNERPQIKTPPVLITTKFTAPPRQTKLSVEWQLPVITDKEDGNLR